MSRIYPFLLPLLIATVSPASELVGQPVTAPRTLIVDLAEPLNDGNVSSNRVFSIATVRSRRMSSAVDSLLDMLATLRTPGGQDAAVALEFLRANTSELIRLVDTRWISDRGDAMDIYVFHPPGTEVQIAFQEVERETRLAGDLVAVIQLTQAIITPRGAPVATVTHTVRRLAKRRANLAVAISGSRPKKSQAADGRVREIDAAPAEPAPEKVAASLVTGPPEHVFFSANALFSQVRQATYDAQTKTLQPATKPKEFLVGINYAVRDVFDDRSVSSVNEFLQGFFVGIALEASGKPFNQIAATTGFRSRLPGIGKYLSFATVSPYAGIVWARSDLPEQDGEGVRVKNRYGKGKAALGLSLNLDKALGWVAGKEPAKPQAPST